MIIVAVAIAIPVVMIAAIVAGFSYYIVSDKEGGKLYHDAVVQGPEFGKTTDQNGCIAEGLARLKGVAKPSISQISANDMFVRGCFETAKPVTEFCRDVPSVPYSDWVAGECRKIGNRDASCPGVMDAKHTFCNGL